MKRIIIIGTLLLGIGGFTVYAALGRNVPKSAAELAGDDAHARHEHDGHQGHGTTAKHTDPGPRLLSLAQRIAERTAEEREIGPEKPLEYFGEMVQLPDGREGLQLKEKFGGGMFFGRPDAHVRKTSYALAPLETTLEQKDLAEALHSQMDHQEHQECAQALVNRMWEDGERQLKDTLNFTLILHVTGSDDDSTGGQIVIDDAEPLDVPPEVDQETVDCYVSAFRGIERKGWDRDVSLYFEWPVCINPPRDA